MAHIIQRGIGAAFIALMLMVHIGTGSAQQPSPPPTEPPPVSAEERLTTPPISFTLNNADINVVVQFIGRYTGKPVVKGKDVNAQLTINAPGKVLPYEALDLIYDALRLEGFSVIESDDVIQIVPIDKTSSFDIASYTGDLPADVARQKGRLVRKIIPLLNVRAQAIQEYLTPFLGAHAQITADQRSNKIIITDTVRNIERYEEIISELDVPGFDNLEVRILRVEHADATVLTQIMNQTVIRAAAADERQGGGPQKALIIVTADQRTNSLVVAAPTDRMNGIVDFVQRLDVPKPKDVEVYVERLEFADPSTIAGAIDQIFRRISGRAFEDTVQVRATGRDTLIILASESNYKLILEIIGKLDTEEAQRRETRTYELKYLDAHDTVSELQQLYGDISSNNRWSSYSRRRTDDDVSFVPITRNNSLVVVAPPSEFRLIEDLLEQIDQPLDATEILPRVFRIRYAKADEVQETLNEVFGIQEQRTNFNPWWGAWNNDDESPIGRLTGKVKFTADENTNSIIVITNNPSNYEIVGEMIDLLDRTYPELANTTIVPLQNADSMKLANTLNSLFGKPARPERGEEEEAQPFTFWWGADQGRQADERPISNLIDQVRFVPDPRTNSILVTTAAQNFDVIRTMIEDLDREEPQVLIKVRIIEITSDRDRRVGLRWTPDSGIYSPEDLDNSIRALNGLDILSSTGDPSGPGLIGTSSSVIPGREITRDLDGGRAILSTSINLDLLLQLLIRNFDSEIIISPSIYISNNEAGRIFVGQNIPRLTDTQITPEGTRNDSFQNEDIGIDMEITPNISTNGTIVLNVALSTAQTTGETRFGSDILQKREYDTRVAVRDGETMVLGGIRLNDKISTIRKFPILGDLPLIGFLFRNTNTQNQTTDLYAFITPQIVSNKLDQDAALTTIRDSIGEPEPPIFDTLDLPSVPE